MMQKTIRLCAIIFLAWFAASALTPLTSIAIRNSTIDSTTIGATIANTVQSVWTQVEAPPPNPVPVNTVTYGVNGTIGGGEADVVLNHGSGSTGGLSFYEANGSGTWFPASPTVKWDKNGNFFAATSVNAPSIVGTLNGNVVGNVSGNVTGNISGTVTGSLIGNASTATALAANPPNCPAGQYATGIQANGTADCGTLQIMSTGNGSSCTTGSSSFSTCGSTVTWEHPFADNGYRFSCTIVGASDPRAAILGITSKTATTAQVTMVTEGSVAITFSGLDCVALHN